MYRGKRRYRKSTKEKARRIWMAYASILLITGMTAAFTFMAMVVLAAPKEQDRIFAGSRDVSGNEILAGNMDVSGNEILAGNISVSGNEIWSKGKGAGEEPYVPLIVIDAGHGGEDVGCMEG